MPLCELGAALSPSLAAFIVFQTIFYSFVGASAASSIVMLSEELPIERRAAGESYGGLAMGLGGGLTVFLMPVLVQNHHSWRWLLVLASAGIALVPLIRRAMPESRRWEHALSTGITSVARFYDLFGPLYRRRAGILLVCSLVPRQNVIRVTKLGECDTRTRNVGVADSGFAGAAVGACCSRLA